MLVCRRGKSNNIKSFNVSATELKPKIAAPIGKFHRSNVRGSGS